MNSLIILVFYSLNVSKFYNTSDFNFNIIKYYECKTNIQIKTFYIDTKKRKLFLNYKNRKLNANIDLKHQSFNQIFPFKLKRKGNKQNVFWDLKNDKDKNQKQITFKKIEEFNNKEREKLEKKKLEREKLEREKLEREKLEKKSTATLLKKYYNLYEKTQKLKRENEKLGIKIETDDPKPLNEIIGSEFEFDTINSDYGSIFKNKVDDESILNDQYKEDGWTNYQFNDYEDDYLFDNLLDNDNKTLRICKKGNNMYTNIDLEKIDNISKISDNKKDLNLDD